MRRLRSLITSRIFRIRGETIVFLPSFLDLQQFYLTLDYHFLAQQFRIGLYPEIGASWDVLLNVDVNPYHAGTREAS